MQSHHHRDEWWIALDNGIIAEVDGFRHVLQKGEQLFIPKHSKHRLAAGECAVRVLEIAFGHFDEKDITRYEDDYGRV